MSGIYVHFHPGGADPSAEDAFRAKISERTTVNREARLEIVTRPRILAAVAHHGLLSSGGLHTEPDEVTLCTGSCWLESTDDSMASPERVARVLRQDARARTTPFKGTFALAHCDERMPELVVETDRFGAIPVYYRRLKNGFIVSTELKFLRSPGGDEPDEDALGELMAFGYVPGNRTLLKGVARIPEFTRAFFGTDGVRFENFRRPFGAQDEDLDEAALAEYDAMVHAYFARFRNSSPKFTISLSGGLDSRIVAAAALQDGFDVHAFTVGEPGSLDAKVARQVADMFDIPIVGHDIDGRVFPDYFARTVWLTEGRVHPCHMHYMSVNLSGEVPPGPQFHGLAGETILGGHFDVPRLQDASAVDLRQACSSHAAGLNYWPPGSWSNTFSPALRNQAETCKERVVTEILDRLAFDGSYAAFVEFRYRFRMTSFSNPCLMSQVLPWADVICPFLDSDNYDYGTRLRRSVIADRAGQLNWGLRFYPVIANLPRVKAGVLIDLEDHKLGDFDAGLVRLKRLRDLQYYLCRLSLGRINLPIRRSFPNYGQWYRRWRHIRSYVDGVLLSDRCLDRGFFKREGVAKLLHDCRIGRETWGAVSTMLLAEVFLRQFVDGDDIPQAWVGASRDDPAE